MTAVLRPVTHRLVGHPTHVANVLRAAHARGHLLDHGRPEPLTGHRVAITVTLLQPAPAHRPQRAGPRPAAAGRATSPSSPRPWLAGPRSAGCCGYWPRPSGGSTPTGRRWPA
jgi:hypothetical protein